MSADWLNTYGLLETRGLWLAAPWQGRLVVSGADARAFLQNFCTNDVLRAPAGSVVEAFFLNTKGHILHHGVLTIGDSQIVIYLVGSSAAELRDHLARYVIREKVELELLETPWWLAIGGPWEATWTTGGGQGIAPQPLAECHICPFPLLHRPAWIIESSLPRERLQLGLERAGYSNDGEQIVGRVFETLRIESGLPLPGIDYSAGTLPQELDRNRQAIHFEKGCYLGQETVARLDALGHVNKLLRGVRFADDSSPVAPTPMSFREKEVGQVTSLTHSPRLGTSLGLAIVRREAAGEGTELTWAHGIGIVTALPVPKAEAL